MAQQLNGLSRLQIQQKSHRTAYGFKAYSLHYTNKFSNEDGSLTYTNLNQKGFEDKWEANSDDEDGIS